MLKSLFKPSPSKFGRGVPLLWRGNSLAVLNDFILKLSPLRKVGLDSVDDEVFLFESARSAIYNCFKCKRYHKTRQCDQHERGL